MTKDLSGWEWMDNPDEQAEIGEHINDVDLIKSAARCFSDHDGQRLLDYLFAITRNRSLGPDATDAELRHLEGQRHLVAHIHQLINKGREQH